MIISYDDNKNQSE